MSETAVEIHRPKHPELELPTVVTPMTMIDRALASNATPETLERLLALQERWEANQARKAFDDAIAAAKSEIPVIRKNRHVGYTHRDGSGATDYWHEDLAEIARTVDPILSKHGLSYRYRSAQADGRVSVTCILTHRDGYSEETTLSAAPDASGKKNSIQQVGSAITYLQRYTLKMALGLAAAQDDDGKSSEAPDFITTEQRNELQRLIEDAEGDVPTFCRWAKINSLPELPSKDFAKAKQALQAKIQQKRSAK